MSLQSIADLIVHTKTVTSQEPVFTVSLEQRTENPRVENTVITAIKLNFEGSDLIGALFMSEGFVWKGLFLSFLLTYILDISRYSRKVTRDEKLYRHSWAI